MVKSLPMELVCSIIAVHAQERVAHDDLSSAFRLARLSRFMHALVLPIAYHTLFITRANCDSLAAVANQPATPLSNVRSMSVDFDANEDNQPLRCILAACSNVEFADASWTILRQAWDIPTFAPRCVALYRDYTPMQTAVPLLQDEIAQCITHVEGFYRSTDSDDLPDWVSEVLGHLPAATHVAIHLDHRLDGDARKHLRNVCRIVSALLQCARLQQVVLHITRDWADKWDALDGARSLAQLRNPRVFAWVDPRLYGHWRERDKLFAQDLREGRSVWNSGEWLYRV